jgi:alpha-glucoside transport system permease protein
MQEILLQIGRALLAMVLGIGGSFIYFVGIDRLIDRLFPIETAEKIRPWAFIAPVVLILTGYLIFPVVRTIIVSFYGERSEQYVGLANYQFAFTNDSMLIAFRNNAIWLVVATAGTVGLGLLIAVLADRVPYERLVKTLIFMPMAISFVGAGVVWKYIYAFRPAISPQIGVLNAINHEILNNDPVAWLFNTPQNTFFLILVFVWIWTGFSVVVLSAALKGIPTELLESARVYGANEWQVFWRIMVPMIGSTIAVVATTMVIYVLKIFDIVYVMTNGNRRTEVIANRMYKEMFQFRDFGRASAIAVILLITIIPMMVINIRRFRQQEAQR